MSGGWGSNRSLAVGYLIIFTYLTGCAFLKPMPERQSLESRLKAFPVTGLPLRAKAEIHWDGHQIPFIQAADDRDLPFLIGMVHAHLRLAQMEVLRRASQGRLSEMMGPFTADIDHLIRTIDFARAMPEIRAGLPSETETWLRSYGEGINFYVKNSPSLPPELSVLGIQPEPWTLEDLIILGRLITTDVNWLFWSMQFRIKQQPEWPQLWARFKTHAKTSLPSFEPGHDLPAHLMLASSKAGSNSFAVSGSRTKSGSSLIASDPHVGLQLPPLWVIIGYRSPSYHVLGLSLPGQPFVVVGRNRSIAWGGTNMLSLSSTFYDISDPSFDRLSERRELIKVRGWFDRRVTIRESSLGPVVTDSKYLKKAGLPRLALKWRGHTGSDEFTTFLKVNRADSWDAFRSAFESWAVSGQNFLFADTHGNIGQVMAVEFSPAASRAGEQFLGDPHNPRHTWQVALKSTDLPAAVNPEKGFLVSTNNTPIKTDLPLSLFGNSNDRFLTISAALKKSNPTTVADLMQIQTDVFSRDSLKLAKSLVSLVENSPPAGAEELVAAMAAWDGNYTVDSPGAAAFELTAYHLAFDYYKVRYGEAIARALLRMPVVYAFLEEDVRSGQVLDHLPNALMKAATQFKKSKSWGKLHVMRLSHPLGNAPLIGKKYRFAEQAVPGSTNTVYKSAHPLADGPHTVTYGANARHVSDLSDPDENYFALVGGQDGYWNSANFLDLFHLWRRKQYVRVPMRPETVRENFAHHMALIPAGD